MNFKRLFFYFSLGCFISSLCRYSNFSVSVMFLVCVVVGILMTILEIIRDERNKSLKQLDTSNIRGLLSEVEQALDDWIVTYASEFCDEESVKAAWKRITDNGGTLAYVTDLKDRLHFVNKNKP